MVVALYVLGVSSIKEFAAPLMVGIACGAYTSVCITGALWYVMKIRTDKTVAAAALQTDAEGKAEAIKEAEDKAAAGTKNSKAGKKHKKKKRKH